MKQIAIALLVEVPDDWECDWVQEPVDPDSDDSLSNNSLWLVIESSNGESEEHLDVLKWEVHPDPDAIFGPSQVWLIQEQNPSALLSDRGYWHDNVEGFVGWGDIRTATRFTASEREACALPNDGQWIELGGSQK